MTILPPRGDVFLEPLVPKELPVADPKGFVGKLSLKGIDEQDSFLFRVVFRGDDAVTNMGVVIHNPIEVGDVVSINAPNSAIVTDASEGKCTFHLGGKIYLRACLGDLVLFMNHPEKKRLK